MIQANPDGRSVVATVARPPYRRRTGRPWPVPTSGPAEDGPADWHVGVEWQLKAGNIVNYGYLPTMTFQQATDASAPLAAPAGDANPGGGGIYYNNSIRGFLAFRSP